MYFLYNFQSENDKDKYRFLISLICFQLSPVGNADADSPFEVTADKRENMPQRSGRRNRGRRSGRGRSNTGANNSSAGSKQPLTEQNPVATTRSNAKM